MYCFGAYKDASLKIDELKKYDDTRLDKGLVPEHSDFLLVAFFLISFLHCKFLQDYGVIMPLELRSIPYFTDSLL